ncbi:MAG: protein phosphatase CheZ [Zoogloeaceae bacterium]|nr:protein phosphatase CheZ [Zoogloeaceae bacterium]
MAKKMKFDDSGDSDDLQALFDSIASAPVTPKLEVVSAQRDGADTDDLQALFDEVAAEFDGPEAEGEAAGNLVPDTDLEGEGDETSEHSCDAVFTKLGHMTRQLHDTLRALGYDQALQDAADAVPDARERLVYIAKMTEQAASRVLNAADIAQPIQEQLHQGAEQLHQQWERLFAKDLTVGEFKALAEETRSFLGSVVDGSRTTRTQLLEIVMAQDFQDLTGQVIKKVLALAQQLESDLIRVLIEAMPVEKRAEKLADKHSGLMNGPVISAKDRDDVVADQEQVDDLLESLGF